MKIQVEDLGYVYNKGTPLEIPALERISFVWETGQVLGILGGTGSGKTTLIRNLAGFLVPTRGRILIDGVDCRNRGAGLGRRIGVVFQRPERQLFGETVLADISFVLRRFSGLPERAIRDRVVAVCHLVGLDIERIGDRSPHALSDGEKRKVAIAAILVNDPETLILDEPAVGLDPLSVSDLVKVIGEIRTSGAKAIAIVSHDMEVFLPILDRMMVLDRGRMAAVGSPAEVCSTLGNDPAMRSLLPPLPVLVADLRKAGYPLDADEFRVSVLAKQIAAAYFQSGGGG